jgi:hypothetical protein
MTPPGDDPSELERLLMELVDGELSPSDRERLAELLRGQPALREQYLDYLLLDSLLHWEQPVAARPAPARPAGWGRWYVTAAAGALAAGLVLAVVLWRRSPAPADATEPTDDTVAVLLHTSGAVWGESSLPTRPGAPLAPGRLRLKAGVAQLEFYCGATVILQGPADFQIISRTRAYCAEGRLRTTVPPQADGFTIETPTHDVVDRGTEFGLSVGAGDRTEVHVFQGKVELYGTGAAGRTAPQQALTTGQGVRLGPAGAANLIPTDPTAFMTARELEARRAAELAERQKLWQTASEAWRDDPTLLVYYPFRGTPAWSRTLKDEAGGGREPHDGVVVGCAWGGGRWPDKPGLEFKRVSDRVRFRVPGEFASLTLAAWVRPDALPNQNNSLMMVDGWGEGGLHWQVGVDGTVILGVRAPLSLNLPPALRGAHYRAFGAITPERFGRWVHLAVVYDRAAGRVTHYLDGRPVSEQPIQYDVPLRVGDAQLGNWDVASYRSNSPVRNFTGCMDEFMLFSRALTGPEVERLAALGQPPL